MKTKLRECRRSVVEPKTLLLTTDSAKQTRPYISLIVKARACFMGQDVGRNGARCTMMGGLGGWACGGVRRGCARGGKNAVSKNVSRNGTMWMLKRFQHHIQYLGDLRRRMMPLLQDGSFLSRRWHETKSKPTTIRSVQKSGGRVWGYQGQPSSTAERGQVKLLTWWTGRSL